MLSANEISRARSALHSLDPGMPREEWVRIAMAAKSAGLEFDAFDGWSAKAANYSGERDTASVWRSVKPEGGIGAGTLFAMATAAGWREEVKHANGHSEAPQASKKTRKAAPHGDRPSFDYARLWADSEPATAEHAYIVRKGGRPDGLRVYSGALKVAGQALDSALLVPAYDGDGKLQSWQAIPAGEGKKLNAPGTSRTGARFVVGTMTDTELVYLCEGIGAAWTVADATGAPAVCCFGAGNMERIAVDLHKRHPAARLVVVCDRGKERDGERIARKVSGVWVELPDSWPNNADINDVHQRDGIEAAAALLAQVRWPEQRYRLLTAEELAALPPVQWRVQGVLPCEGLGSIFGQSGSGKSFLTLDLLGAVSDGLPWFGARTEACSVVYVALEGEHGIAQRLNAYREQRGRLPARLRFIAQPFGLRTTADVAELAEAISADGGAGGIVAIDTLNRAAPGADENSSADMGAIIEGAKALQTALGGLVLLVHHTGKDPNKGMRGHSSLHAALDAAIEVSRDGDRRDWRVAKSKDGADGEPHQFRLDVVELGTDADGEPVTSCTIVEVVDTGADLRRVLPPKAGNQKAAWDALGEPLRNSMDQGRGGAPSYRPCIRLDEALAAVSGRLVCDPKRRSERAAQAVQGLVNRGLLGMGEGWIWIV